MLSIHDLESNFQSDINVDLKRLWEWRQKGQYAWQGPERVLQAYGENFDNDKFRFFKMVSFN